MGRAAIAMAAVRIGACHKSGQITDHSKLRPPTDVMAITSLPKATNCPYPYPCPCGDEKGFARLNSTSAYYAGRRNG